MQRVEGPTSGAARSLKGECCVLELIHAPLDGISDSHDRLLPNLSLGGRGPPVAARSTAFGHERPRPAMANIVSSLVDVPFFREIVDALDVEQRGFPPIPVSTTRPRRPTRRRSRASRCALSSSSRRALNRDAALSAPRGRGGRAQIRRNSGNSSSLIKRMLARAW